MPKPDNTPDCTHRGREGGSICFCRHPAICGTERSAPVKWEQCIACPLRLDPPATEQRKAPKKRTWRLGDQIESALTRVGITKDRVEKWLGEPCGCEERQQKLNQLSEWAQNATAAGLNKLIGR